MAKFVALLRGINVGGHKKVPMKELKKVFETQGFEDVKTLLASGNVVFKGAKGKTKTISKILEQAFGFEINTIVVPHGDIEKIIESAPFKTIKVTSATRLYVTFLREKPNIKFKTPYWSEDRSFKILKIIDKTIFSVLDAEKGRSVDSMAVLEKTFGKGLTTRNYNTVVKIANL